MGYALFYGGLGVALLGYLGLLSQREPISVPVRAVRLAAVVGQASFVSYVVQQWFIDFVPIWVGFDSWLTPATVPLYLALNTVIMCSVAFIWGRHKANRFMTLRGPIDLPGLRTGPRSALAQLRTAAVAVVLAVAINLLVLQHASELTPPKLGLVTANPYPWVPAQVAGH